MSARYESRTPRWSYTCWGESTTGAAPCWSVAGPPIDRAVERLFLETMVPSELDLSIAVEGEVQQQADALEKAWRARIEQVRYEARRAERRYKAVDPDNRVVARTLESDWEHRLLDLEAVEQQYAEARRHARVELTSEDRSRIRQLARDLPAVWSAATTIAADRKAMLRLVIEAIAAHRELLQRVGYEVEPFSGRTVVIATAPNPHPRFDAAHDRSASCPKPRASINGHSPPYLCVRPLSAQSLDVMATAA